MPERLSRSERATSGSELPSDEMIPIPVTTTRRMNQTERGKVRTQVGGEKLDYHSRAAGEQGPSRAQIWRRGRSGRMRPAAIDDQGLTHNGLRILARQER